MTSLMNDPPFNGAPTGPISMPPRDAAPIAYFYLLFSIDLIKEFVKQTNRGSFPSFFNMGLIRKVSIEEYLNKHNPSQSTPWFRCMFSRNRFQKILNFLHLVDTKKLPKRNDPAYRPSQRFKPLLDFVNRKFLRFYNPRRELAVDESLVGTKGKTSMLQYIPSKRSRFGVKFLMLVESVTGYVLQKDVYHGKHFDPTPAGTLQGTNVVMNLMKSSNLLGQGFHVFADSFFASLNLVKKLLRERTYLTDTMRTNRPMPQMIKNARPYI
ncbi:piggyBac transposable element-derived protein 4-like [Mytilus edulis]|uniref:piggyBac transposable element-derived protein 4-like n=1 Tax=Mytilus edulis TaxID=6550 RepID=UPI0039F0169B